jgi:hypothetical protein
MFLASPRKGCLMSAKALLKLRELLINRRNFVPGIWCARNGYPRTGIHFPLTQITLEPVNGHTIINSISAACIFEGVEAYSPAE